jgi:hypothetical protein
VSTQLKDRWYWCPIAQPIQLCRKGYKENL